MTIGSRSPVFPSHALALRIGPDVTGCGEDPTRTLLPFNGGVVTAWPR